MTELEHKTLTSLYSMREVIGMYCDSDDICIDMDFNTRMCDVCAALEDAIGHMEKVINDRIYQGISDYEMMSEQHRQRWSDVI